MNMTMTYDGTMVMPKNYAVVTEDEMTYVEGGGTLKYSVSFRFTDALCQAAYAGGISTVIGTITACVSAALGATGIGAIAIGAVVGFASSILSSYLTRNVKGFTKTVSGSMWIPSFSNHSINKNITIGW